MNGTPPPGWYPDYAGSGQRYWDGQRWTEHVAPGITEPAQAHPEGTPTQAAGGSQPNWMLRHKFVSGVLAFVLLVFIAGALGSGNESPNGTTDTAAETVDDSEASISPASGTETEETEPEPVDTDGDGVSDPDDFRPNNPKIQTRDDLDTDKDGVRDGDDFRPKDPKVQTRDDIDTDRDGVPDYKDDFPKNAKYSRDTDDDGVADQLDAFPRDPKYSRDADDDGVADAEDAFPQDPSRSKITLAMENALASARDYIDYSAFSRQGLIDQLSSKYGAGYKVEDATWAVNQLGVDWKQQAVRAAKDYLDYSSFSRQGLIDQLSSPYGARFTLEEATYAVNKIGL